MKSTVAIAVAVGAAAGVFSSVSAQARDTARTDTMVYRVPEVMVRGVRSITTVGGASSVQVNVDSLSIRPAAALSDVLREMPLLHIRTNSRGEAEISARGSESRQVAVLVDGIPLTLAWDARADVSVIPATAPQDISYTRGLSSMLYGPNALGGVVNISLVRAPFQAERSITARTGFDHVGGYGGSAAITLPFHSGGSQFVMRAGAGYRESPGEPVANGVVERPQADELRLNTDSRTVDGFLAMRYRAENGAWASLSTSTFQAKRGMAAELGVPDADARFWRYPHVSRTIATVSGGSGHHASPFGGVGDVEASFGIDVGRTDIDAFTTPAYNELDSFEDGKDRTLTARLLADQTIGSFGDLRAALMWSDIRHHEFLPAGDAVYRQRLMSAGLESVFRLIDGGPTINALQLTVGGAYDAGETPEAGGREPLGRITEWGGRVGLSMGLNQANTVIHAGVSRRGRFPALRELYSGALNRFAPNPDLKPERLIAAEAGVTVNVGTGQAQLVGFRQTLEDAVVRTTLPDGRFMRVNRNELESTGVEFLFSQMFGPVGFAADVTLQSVDLTDTEEQVTNRPENLPEVLGNVRVSVPLVADFKAAANAHYTGSQFCIDPGTGEDRELEAATRLDAELSRAFHVGGRAFEARVSVDNVTDDAIYDQCGLPQPGRLLRFQLSLP